jgi:roadblock/LC7 domain-containing protein
MMMATTLDELVKIDGVALAFEYGPDGKLIKYKASMAVPDEMAAGAAQFCATITMVFNTLAGAFTQMSKQNWTPQLGWAYASGEWTVAIGGNGYRGVFIQTAKADFNKLFETLIGSR